MLILGRKIGDSLTFRFGEIEMKITVVNVRGTTVRIGIEAPRDVQVIRTEILDAEATP